MLAWLVAAVRNLGARARIERALDEELRASIELLEDEHRRAGLAPEEARRRALVDLGGLEQVREEVRGARAGALVEAILQDVRLAARAMRRSPGFTAAATLTMALAIGLNTAVFSVLDALVLRAVPYSDASRLVAIYNAYPRLSAADSGQNSIPDYVDRRALTGIFESIALFVPGRRTAGLEPAPASVRVEEITPSVFDVLRLSPTLGRRFTDGDVRPGAARVAVLGYGFWQRAYAGRASALGTSIRVDGTLHEIVGVMPPAFRILDRDPDLILPLVPTVAQLADTARHGNLADMVGRLRDGVGVASAQGAVDALNARNLERLPELGAFVERSGFRTVVRGLGDYTVRQARPVLLLVQAGALLLLVIACANVSNLVLIRSHARRGEMALRSALGASRPRLARQFVTEGFCLAGVGAAGGVAVAMALLEWLVAALADRVPVLAQVGVDTRALAAAAGLAALSALVFGLLPVLHVSGRRVDRLLGGVGRSVAGDRRGSATRAALVVVEVALAVVLAVGGGLLAVSLARAAAQTPGFDATGVLTARLTLSATACPDDASVQRATRRLVEAVGALPQVRHAAVTTVLPFSGDDNRSTARVEQAGPGTPGAGSDDGGTLPLPHNSWIEGDYFTALGVPLVEGRLFDGRDVAAAPPVAIVDRAFAERHLPGLSPIGRRIRRGSRDGAGWITVVGVVGSIKYHQVTEPHGHGSVYYAQAQPSADALLRLRRALALVARTNGDPEAAVAAVRSAVLSTDPSLPLFDVMPMERRIEDSLLDRRLPARLSLVFGLSGLLLAALGVYGVSAFGVSQRTREIGVRLALGANPAAVVKEVVLGGGRQILAGIAIGLAGALAVSRLLAGLLYDVAPGNVGVVATAAVVVLAAGFVGCLVPARRAGRLDIVATLRQD